jgi:hypothetical protein
MHPLQLMIAGLVLIILIEEFVSLMIGLWPGRTTERAADHD